MSRGGTAGLRGAKHPIPRATIASRRFERVGECGCWSCTVSTGTCLLLRRREHHQIVRVYVPRPSCSCLELPKLTTDCGVGQLRPLCGSPGRSTSRQYHFGTPRQSRTASYSRG